MKKEKKQKLMGLVMVLPSFLIIAVIIAFPIVQSILISFQAGNTGGFTFVNYYNLFTNKNYFNNIIYTLDIVVKTVILAIVLSYLLALYITFSKSWFATVLEKLYMIPRFIPGIVAVYAFMGVIRDTGAINRFLLIFGINFKPNLLYTPGGIITMNLWFNIPFATMIIGAALAGIQPAILESARDVGAGRLEIFRKMIFPLSYKSALVAATFVFMGNVGEFTTPFLLGANSPRMLGVALYQQFGVFYDLPQAAAMAVFMFIVSAFAGAVYIYTSMKDEKWNIQD
ncbi:ABC transporter permease [Desulfitobacterium sp.]|uniref:ABC transporter permease n=1 Tax=Desulfitobacterium sp. TaxID=49981 RepID=UPI002C634E19|nr:ABC transporter permease [Desulfitobacterium sp.]HVJ48476.1 ABC transporter permease [Desulfitobacterium sp.]